VANLHDCDCQLSVVNGVEDSIVALAKAILFLSGECFGVGGARLGGQLHDLAGDTLQVLGRQCLELLSLLHTALRPGRTRAAAAEAALPTLGGAGAIAYSRSVPIQLPQPRRSRSVWLSLLPCVALSCVVGCTSPPGNPTVPAGATSSGGRHAVIETDQGVIELEFFEAAAPTAVENFRLLAEHGYYDGLTFHRVVRGFMIQGGDPAGDGTGGESAWGGTFADEIDLEAPLYQGGYRRGLVAMANAGPNTNGSQFFIMHQDYQLAPNYVIFARVTGGMDVVDALAGTPTTMGSDGGMSQPVTPPVMTTVAIRP
jgi:cyclophilin family peptidyl-prolyl cis-trans isomerase